jgi:hypothetical protein
MGTKLFGKVFQQIYDSTVAADWEVMTVWIHFIILADENGVVDIPPFAIARRTGLPQEMVEKGIAELEKSDPLSRSKDAKGARLVRLDEHRDWGWRLPTYGEYSKRLTHEQKKQADRDRMREKRAKKIS